MRTNTIYVDLKKLYKSGESEASLIIGLMLACNDIALANYCMSNFKTETFTGIQQHIKQGALLYFVRLQCGHLKEALSLIDKLNEQIEKHIKIQIIYSKCSQAAQSDFLKLKNCLKRNSQYNEFKNKVELLRHKTVFHYDANKLFEKAIKRRSENQTGRYSSITRSNDVSCLRFNMADDIIDTVVCRFLWKINDDADLRKEADNASDFGSDLCKSFINFCSEFIFRYVKEHGAR